MQYKKIKHRKRYKKNTSNAPATTLFLFSSKSEGCDLRKRLYSMPLSCSLLNVSIPWSLSFNLLNAYIPCHFIQPLYFIGSTDKSKDGSGMEPHHAATRRLKRLNERNEGVE